MGYDVHKLVEERELILGGVTYHIRWDCWDIPMQMYCFTQSWMHC